MIATASFVTYLLHYLAGRLLYDELVRPLFGGRWLAALALLVAIVLVAGLLRRRPRVPRRRPRVPRRRARVP